MCFTTIICEQKLNQSVDIRVIASEEKRGHRSRPRGAQTSSFHNLLLDHTNYMLCKGLKIYNRKMLTRSSQRIFNQIRNTDIEYVENLHNILPYDD